MFENLTDIFVAAAAKYLTAVDAEASRSNQHEIGGLPKSGMGAAIGYPVDGTKIYLAATMVYLSEETDDPVICEDTVTWYDSRFTDPTRSPEYRLYYRSNDVTEIFREGDFLLVALTKEQSLLMIFCRAGSQTENQLKILFGASEVETEDKLKKIPIEQSSVVTPIRLMLARYGIELEVKGVNDDELLERIRDKYSDVFPATKEFSTFARSFCEGVCAFVDPDGALITWMEKEEHLFRLLERHIVRAKLKQGFGEKGDDVDDFVGFSLSVQNRRKSRVGHAFENHIEEILTQNKLPFERGVKTEGKQKPDFLFPGRAAYINSAFPDERLRILAAKTTCKDRWRQVLPEADRIKHKHLITLEPSISIDQTDQMKARNLQLVVPSSIQTTYLASQREWLYSLADFLKELRDL